MSATYTLNPQHNGIEITFPGKPGKAILEALKAEGFRWHSVKRLWYAKQTEKRLALAQSITNTGSPAEAPEAAKNSPKAAKAEAVNKYGVKVGDLFWSSWGYDQTNTDFFQVIALVGSSSVRVRQVCPPSERVDAYRDGSTVDTYHNTGKLFPPAPFSVFINDQENGDLKRLKSYMKDGSRPQFKLSGFADAWKVESETITLREDHGYR